jgi:signal transduction histidine kinase
MWRHLRALIHWEPRGLGPYETIRARRMWGVLLVLTSFTALLCPVQFLIGMPSVALVPAAFLVLYFTALRLLQDGRQQLAAAVVVWGSLLVISVILVPLGGLRGPTTIFLEVGALVAVLWLDPRHAAVAVGAFVLVLLGLPAMEELWVGAPQWTPPEGRSVGLLVSLGTAIVVTAAVAGAVTDALMSASALAEARASEAAAAERAAQEAIAAKSRFLATMSHELRTPLSAILGYAGLLREEGGPSEPDLHRIDTAGRQLLALVEDVLEVARGENKPYQAVAEPIELRRLVEEEVAALHALGLPLLVKVEGPSVLTSGDSAHLRRILSNMLQHVGRTTYGHVQVRVEPEGRGGRVAMECPAESAGVGLALAQRLAGQLGTRLELGEDGLVLSLPTAAHG